MTSGSDLIGPLSYAFQPIVQARTGHCFGYEALLRGHEQAGFASIADVFDSAYRDRRMFPLECALRDLAMRQFAKIPHHRSTRLFLNVDPRLFEMPDYRPSATVDLVEHHGLKPEAVSFEICEQTELRLTEQTERILEAYRTAGFHVAIDDFGVGFAG